MTYPYHQLYYNQRMSRIVEDLIFQSYYVAPTPASTFLVYHRLERWGA